MNKYEHAASSAKLFGGDWKDYYEFHATINSNKVVTPSIFGRFFLHHIDVGLPIVQKIFGETLGSEEIPTKHLFLQHLLEDYGQILTLKHHWMPVLEEVKDHLPKLDTWENFLVKAKNDPRLVSISEKTLEELEGRFYGKGIEVPKEFWRIENKATYKKETNPLLICIFGHALGGDLLTKIIGRNFHCPEGILSTLDLVTGYLNCRFVNTDRHKDNVPTLLDWEKHIPDKPWMHAPKDYGQTIDIKSKIGEYEKNAEKTINILFEQSSKDSPEKTWRSPCNID